MQDVGTPVVPVRQNPFHEKIAYNFESRLLTLWK
jgi:hypothetical protein